MTAAMFFADRLSRERELTAEETDRLCRATPPGPRKVWSAKELRAADRMAAKGMLAPEIASLLGRSAWAVRCRLHRGRKQQNTVEVQNATG